MNLRKNLILVMLFTLGLFLLAGCSEFEDESNIGITAVKGYGDAQAITVNRNDIKSPDTDEYGVTVYFEISNYVGAYIYYYKIEYYRHPEMDLVDTFPYEGEIHRLTQEGYMNQYIPPATGAVPSTVSRPMKVVNEDLFDYIRSDTELTRLSVKITFFGADSKENDFELPGYIDILIVAL